MINVITIIAARHADSYLSPFSSGVKNTIINAKRTVLDNVWHQGWNLYLLHTVSNLMSSAFYINMTFSNVQFKCLHHIKERARKMWQESSSLLQIKSLEYNLSCCVERNLFLSQNFVSQLFCTFAACLMAGSVVTLTNKNYYFLIICSTFKIHFC